MAQVKSKVKFEQDGNVSYKRSVVIQIIELSAKEIAGVASFCTSRSLAIRKMFSKNFKKGVDICFLEDGIQLELYLNITFGYAVNDVAYRVQENVKRSIESMTEYKVKRINVHIVGVSFDELEEAIS